MKEELGSYNRNLYKKHTWASLGRSVVHQPELEQISTVRDKLDFTLDSVYCHSLELFPLTSDIVRQKETFQINPWRCLRERKKTAPDASSSKLQSIVQDEAKRKKRNLLDISIPPAHSAKTNAGYSRNIDGTFFKI